MVISKHHKISNSSVVSVVVLRILDVVCVGYGFIFIHQMYGYVTSVLYTYAGFLAACIFLLNANTFGLYQRSGGLIQGGSVNNGLLMAWASTLSLLLLIAYATKTSSIFSRLAVASWIILVPIALLVGRWLVGQLFSRLLLRSHSSKKVALFGAGENAKRFFLTLKGRESDGHDFSIEGIYVPDVKSSSSFEGHEKELIKGGIPELIQDVQQGQYDEVYIATSIAAQSEINNLIIALSDCSIPVYFVPDIFTLNLMTCHVFNIDGIPVVSIYDTPMDGSDIFLKRVEDVVVSILILMLAAIPMLLIACFLKITSGGPVIFRQRRYGLGGEPIEIWKFRTMSVCEDGLLVPQARQDDHRVTGIGRVLRKTSMDELPQFINVLKGQMSVVGPRPHAIAHNELYRKDIQGYMLRHLVKPGITGWAQVNGWRGETDKLEKMEKRVQYDLEYIKNWSILLDLKIILLTIYIVLTGKNAY